MTRAMRRKRAMSIPATAPIEIPLSDEGEDTSGVASATLAARVVPLAGTVAFGEVDVCILFASAATSVGVVFVAVTASAVAVVVVVTMVVEYKPGIVSAGTVPWF